MKTGGMERFGTLKRSDGGDGLQFGVASWVRSYPDVLDPRTVAGLVAIMSQSPGLRRSIDGGGFHEWRVPVGDLSDQVRRLQQDLAGRYANDCGIEPRQWPGAFGYEVLRLKRYASGDHFPPHVDVVDHRTARRFLAFLWCIEAPDQGGATAFLPNGPLISPQAGACLVFPPLWPFLHAGQTVTGVKTILSGYLHYL